MAPGKNDSEARKAKQSKGGSAKPAWADGLKQLYDSVVDEPLPNDLADLLAKLDSNDDESGQKPRGGHH